MSTDVYIDFWDPSSTDENSGPTQRIGYLGYMICPAYEILGALQYLNVAFPIVEPFVSAGASRLAVRYQAMMRDSPFLPEEGIEGWETDSPTPEELETLFNANIGQRWRVRVD